MNPVHIILPVLLATTVATAAAAQPPMALRSEAYQRCMTSGDAARGNATAIDLCAGTEQAVQDVRLDEAYDRAMGRLGILRQIGLHNSQAEWRAGSEKLCAELAGVDRRGDSSGRTYNSCLLDETIARAAWLESYTPE